MTKSASANADLTMSDLFENPTLRTYLSNVRDWHGYVRFLGLPDRRDNPDVLIDRLFVEPLLTRRHVSPDENPSNWIDEAETVFDALATGKPLVLLGDPGTGKSTLLNYLVWLLARPTSRIWTQRMGTWLLPVPMVLRELRLRGVKNFSGLLDTFLDHSMSQPLRDGEYLHQALADGKAFILLDGIDEIGDLSVRKGLREAVFDGFARHPDCRWLLSSRIVGYDEAPFERRPEPQDHLSSSRGLLHEDYRAKLFRPEDREMLEPRELRETTGRVRGLDDGPVMTRYIAPFDDRRIEAFARNWYLQREAAATRAGADAMHLVRAVHADDAILRLARTPNLLTMMALIHRVEATLPHGRALLYDRIAEAYLESIDRFRGVYSGAYNLPQKKRWLARVGYEMQRRRNPEGGPGESELLVDSSDVTGWLDEEMERGGTSKGLSTPEEFLDFVGRRSGLFLPRADSRYAFVHLSFQEYFAAVALEREVTGIGWARDESTPLGLNRMTLAEWAGQSIWRETFGFLFELLASKEDWHADLLDAAFGEHFSRLQHASDKPALNLAQLLARLCVNSRSGLARDRKNDAINAAVRPTLRQLSELKTFWRIPSGILGDLLGEDTDWNKTVLEATRTQLEDLKIQILSLANTRIQDITTLSDFDQLELLNLCETRVSDLEPLAHLTALRALDLSGTKISDLTPLVNLTALRALDLSGTKISDLTPLAHLTALRALDLPGTKISDLTPLVNLTALESLDLSGTKVLDIELLANLTALESLDLSGTKVLDIEPLANLTALRRLDLFATKASDMAPLVNLTALESLNLFGTKASDLKPLANLTALEWLFLSGTKVLDIEPLANLTALKWLFLFDTSVSDLTRLTHLTTLRSLHLKNTNASENAIDALRSALPECDIVWSSDR